ncbi:aromatic prenyltransferase [Aspergillus bertholletiae]|uniref:Aromatic prenyltransferase n=1 Tax=Aspergillus bertholletiae TaxID=1226010 RepID=A0A5N7B7R3_9EURO|nr:aromatic prenyltransferase [Aspergillus bertholletiae]
MTRDTDTPGTKQPWKTLGQFLPFENADQRLWWEKTASLMNVHLRLTNYSLHSQYQHLLLFYSVVLPTLGPFPNKARSNLPWRANFNLDGVPLEFSVNYQQNSKCILRLDYDPVGLHAGTNADPTNEAAARLSLLKLKELEPAIDLAWHDHFDQTITLSNSQASSHWDRIMSQKLPFISQRWLALDLREESFLVKSYFSPLVKSAATGVDAAHIMFDSIRKLDHAVYFTAGLAKLKDWFSANRALLMDSEIFPGFDCNDPERARLKVYAGITSVSFCDVRNFWTLGGCLHGPEIETGFQIVRTMWQLLFPNKPRYDEKQDLFMDWNWELLPNNPNPVPKAYFGFHNDSDQHATDILAALFAHLNWTDHLDTHRKITQEAYPTCNLENTSHIVTWICIAYSAKSGPYITTYSNVTGHE